MKKNNYFQKNHAFSKGGFDVPLIVAHTPRGELAKRMREKETQNNQVQKIHFNVVERGGVTLEQKFR